MEHVRQVRVHLVMPESTLFTRDRQQATAHQVVALLATAHMMAQQPAKAAEFYVRDESLAAVLPYLMKE